MFPLLTKDIDNVEPKEKKSNPRAQLNLSFIYNRGTDSSFYGNIAAQQDDTLVQTPGTGGKFLCFLILIIK